MIDKKKFYKLGKYTLKLKKSFIKNNNDDFIRYSDHLKYHLGGADFNGMLDGLLGKINSEKENFVFSTLIEKNNAELEKFKQQNMELTQKIKEITEKLNTNDKLINEINKERSLILEKIKKYSNSIGIVKEKSKINQDNELQKLSNSLDYFFNKYNEKLKNNKNKFKELYHYKTRLSLEKNLYNEELKKKNKEIDNLKLELDNSAKENYDNFKLKLYEIFKIVYPKEFVLKIKNHIEKYEEEEKKKEEEEKEEEEKEEEE